MRLVRRGATQVGATVLLAGCLSRYLDAPLVLVTGLEGPVEIFVDDTTDPQHPRLVVQTDAGAWNLSGDGTTQPGSHYDFAEGLPSLPGLPPTEDIALIADKARLVLTADALYRTQPLPGAPADWQLTPVVTGLQRARSVAVDGRGRAYVVQGRPEPALYRVDGAQLTLIARWVGEVVDMTFGPGTPLLPAENLYLVRADGMVEYLRPP